MPRLSITCIAVFILSAVLVCAAQSKSAKSVTIVMKDGHQKTFTVQDGSRMEFRGGNLLLTQAGKQESFPVADIVRIDFNTVAINGPAVPRNFFVGKWEFGEGVGTRTFAVTLQADGKARKSIGSEHGTWVLVGNEARISWDDGWHDVIRKVANGYEKSAYEPGKPIDGEPSNVASAHRANDQTM